MRANDPSDAASVVGGDAKSSPRHGMELSSRAELARLRQTSVERAASGTSNYVIYNESLGSVAMRGD